MATVITIHLDDETESALDVLTRHGDSESKAVRLAILDAAQRLERATEMRRATLRMDLGAPDGVNVAEKLAGER